MNLHISLFFPVDFYWSTVDLQCCVSFCCTVKWISYTCVHSFFRGFPCIQVIIECRAEFPLVHSMSLLVIFLHRVAFIFQSHLPMYSSSPPLDNHKFFSISVVLYFCFVQFIGTIFLYSTYKRYHIFFFLCLTSLSMTISRYIHVAANGMVLWLSSIPLYISTRSLSFLPSLGIEVASMSWLL